MRISDWSSDVCSSDLDGKIKICAGGRRYRALKLLQKGKTIPGTFEVPVDLRSKDEALEISLAENAQREAMHPADAILAYRAIIDSGKEVDDVAARSEERRLGKECVSKCSSQWSQDH